MATITWMKSQSPKLRASALRIRRCDRTGLHGAGHIRHACTTSQACPSLRAHAQGRFAHSSGHHPVTIHCHWIEKDRKEKLEVVAGKQSSESVSFWQSPSGNHRLVRSRCNDTIRYLFVATLRKKIPTFWRIKRRSVARRIADLVGSALSTVTCTLGSQTSVRTLCRWWPCDYMICVVWGVGAGRTRKRTVLKNCLAFDHLTVAIITITPTIRVVRGYMYYDVAHVVFFWCWCQWSWECVPLHATGTCTCILRCVFISLVQ